MFLASIVVFLLLSSLDEFRDVIAPFFMKGEERIKALPTSDYEDARSFIKNFNDLLADVYFSSDPSKVNILPADESVKKDIINDMEFLLRSGKIMDVTVDDIVIERVDWFPPITVRVKTREIVTLSYLNLIDKAIIMPEKAAEYQQVYTLEMREGKWIVMRYEIAGVEGIKDTKSGV